MSRIVLVHTFTPSEAFYAKGGLVRKADHVRKAGRMGDTYLLHLNKDEFEWLKSQWGEPTINPYTGLPEYFKIGKIFKKAGKILKKVAPIALPAMMMMFPGIGTAIGGALGMSGVFGSMAGNAILGAGVGALTGGKKGALYGGLSGAAAAGIGSMLGGLGGGANLAADGVTSAGGWNAGADLAAPNAFTNAANALGDSGLGAAYVPAAAAAAPTAGLPQVGGGAPAAAVGAQPTGALTQVANIGKDIMGTAMKNPMMTMMALSALQGKPKEAQPPAENVPDWFHQPLPNYDFQRPRTSLANINWRRYGYGPEQSFFEDNALPSLEEQAEEETQTAAEGGLMAAFGVGGRGPSSKMDYVEGPGSGRDDFIPARLSDGEYVMDAETVALLGDGSTDEGARRLDSLRQNVRKHKGRALARGKFSPNAKSPLAYVAAAGRRS